MMSHLGKKFGYIGGGKIRNYSIRRDIMKAYGLPREKDLDAPDLVDIQNYGLKSSRSRPTGKGGDRKNSFRSSARKRLTRRIWKRKQRIENNKLTREIL
jgi:hypothetical protein